MPDERAALGVAHPGDLWIREVLLIADGVPVVYARSLVPTTSIPAAGTFCTVWAGDLGQCALQRSPGASFAPEAARLDARDSRWHHAARATCRADPGLVGATFGLPTQRIPLLITGNLPAWDRDAYAMTP